jgi:hypothetical protein
MSHPYLIMTFNRPTRAIPNTAYIKNQAKLQHCDDQLTLSSPHHISFPIQRGILFAMASRRITVDSAKKKEFINIFLLMRTASAWWRRRGGGGGGGVGKAAAWRGGGGGGRSLAAVQQQQR